MLLLHKLLPLLLLPLGSTLLLGVCGVLRRSRLWMALGLACLWLCGCPAWSGWLLSRLERQYPAVSLDTAPTADAIVVLSGTLAANPAAPGGVKWLAPDRFEQGLRLYRAGKAPLLIFTGGQIPWAREPQSEGQYLRTAALARGVPTAAVAVTGEIQNTAQEASAVASLAQARGLGRMYLVTTAWHMPRAVFLFRRAGLPMIPYPVDHQINPGAAWTVLDFLPQAKALEQTEIAEREWLGLAFYRLADFRMRGAPAAARPD